MPTAWSIERDGRHIEIVPRDTWAGYRLALSIDGAELGETRSTDKRLTVHHDDLTIRVRLAWHGQSIVRAELVRDGAPPLPLTPEPGSFAARRETFAREHPALFAAQHVVAAIGKVLLPLLGIGALLRLLPDIPLPDVDLPAIPLPDVDLPSIPFPSIDLPPVPGWIEAIAEAAKYWSPILVGIALAVAEYRRRRRDREAEETAVRTPGEQAHDDAERATERA